MSPVDPSDPRPEREEAGNGWWRTVLAALESNVKTVRLITIIVVSTKMIEAARTLR